ncbi:small integral membrane protein 4 [Microplitis demolitor]|uniref:small integral membrane protein 4 n=1 Tax=Microplitis demolitor TaxID=69319 RepID=UPI0006D51232|nr:small integral membrane protein 4 [Microplitis demolitor]
MFFYSKTLRKLLRKWPGRKIFGVYRFLPVFFVTGAGIEFLMINWQVGQVNFYKIYKQKQIQEIVNRKLASDQSKITQSSPVNH